jgi:hypothetical protein
MVSAALSRRQHKTDGVDASHIREYCELFKPKPWAPPSEAHRRLGELQMIRAGIITGLTEWLVHAKGACANVDGRTTVVAPLATDRSDGQ